jgi:hypothetical protein
MSEQVADSGKKHDVERIVWQRGCIGDDNYEHSQRKKAWESQKL